MCMYVYTHTDMHTHTPTPLAPPSPQSLSCTFQEVMVVLVVIYPNKRPGPVLPPDTVASWYLGWVGGEQRDEKQRAWGRPVPLWLSPFWHYCKNLTPGCLFPASCQSGWRCLQVWGLDAAAHVGLSFWEIFLLFIVSGFWGKQSLVCMCMCTHTHTYTRLCMWKCAGQVKAIEELPPVSRIFQRYHLTVNSFRVNPRQPPALLFYHGWRVDTCSQPASNS